MKPFNLLIAGVGGQGVAGLTRRLWECCEKDGLPCRGTIFKGGAQTLGSVYSIIRIFPKETPSGEHRLFSHSFLPGDLDLLLALEPWEALRHIHLRGPATRGIVNEKRIPFWIERHQPISIADPLAALRERATGFVFGGFSAAAIVLDAADRGWLPLQSATVRRAFPEPTADVPEKR